MIKIVAGYILFFVFLIIYIKKLKYKNCSVKELIKAIMAGILSITLVTIISYVFGIKNQFIYNHEPKLYYFLRAFIYGALVEEISKFAAIKICKPSKKDNFIMYALIVGLTFWIAENIVYGLAYPTFTQVQLENRLIHPGHPCYQIIMGALLYLSSIPSGKNKRIILTILTIIFTALIHALFNCLRGYNQYPISKNIISVYITLFEYYTLIIGLYIFKKKTGEKNEKI